jgi:excisionase family DNA binding protein
MDSLLTKQQVCELLHISEMKLYRLRQNGKLPEVDMGDRGLGHGRGRRTVRFNPQVVEEFIRSATN